MLHLASETPRDWALRAAGAMPEVLLDHAHCEKKAASTAVNLIFRYPQHTSLLIPLARLAREELEHFEQVVSVLRERGFEYARQKPSPYAGKLMQIVRTEEPDRLLDTLLVCAYIEARSCERMKLLADVLQDAELVALYRGLLACEARHNQLYLDLAVEIFDADVVRARQDEVAQHEADVLRNAPEIPRLHNG